MFILLRAPDCVATIRGCCLIEEIWYYSYNFFLLLISLFVFLFYFSFLLPSTQLMWFAQPLMGRDSPFCHIFGCTAAVLWGIRVLWPDIYWRCHGWSQGICCQVYDSNVPGMSVKWLWMWLWLVKYSENIHVTNVYTWDSCQRIHVVDLTLKVKYLFVCLGCRSHFNIFLLFNGLIWVPVTTMYNHLHWLVVKISKLFNSAT